MAKDKDNSDDKSVVKGKRKQAGKAAKPTKRERLELVKRLSEKLKLEVPLDEFTKLPVSVQNKLIDEMLANLRLVSEEECKALMHDLEICNSSDDFDFDDDDIDDAGDFPLEQNMCSFCGRDAKQVKHLIRGPFGAICDECVETCRDTITDANVRAANGRRGIGASTKFQVPSPRKIKEFLDLYIVGQEKTKKDLAVAVHNHYLRINDVGGGSGKYKDVELDKSNVLLIGPTGSGKTLFARTLARFLDVPFAIADATTLTEAGYVGEDVENILLSLIQAADMDISKAERGIVYVDEIDKIGRRTENVSITRDVSGEGVQQALLKIIEGTEAHVPPQGGRKHPNAETIKINTHNILFILGGAFVGMDDVIKQRKGRSVVGYVDKNASNDEIVDARIQPEDLIRFGLIPEFVGRIPVISKLAELTEDDLIHILTKPRNCIVSQYQKLLDMEGKTLEFEEDALRETAKLALKRKTGARGLRAVIEQLMTDIIYDVADTPEKKIVITAEMIRNS